MFIGVLLIIGGRGGIRTHGTVARTPDFESGAFNHSATLPACVGHGFARLTLTTPNVPPTEWD